MYYQVPCKGVKMRGLFVLLSPTGVLRVFFRGIFWYPDITTRK